jgi:hypothetical protein
MPEKVKNKLTANDGGGFFDFEKGDNTFRFVCNPVWGYRYTYDFREEDKEEEYPFYEFGAKGVDEDKMKIVMKAVVWDVENKDLKFIEISQNTIINAIQAYSDNDKYGDPKGYNIVVRKTGEGRDTRYSVIAEPPEDQSEDLKEALNKVEINPDSFFYNLGEVIVKKN